MFRLFCLFASVRESFPKYFSLIMSPMGCRNSGTPATYKNSAVEMTLYWKFILISYIYFYYCCLTSTVTNSFNLNGF